MSVAVINHHKPFEEIFTVKKWQGLLRKGWQGLVRNSRLKNRGYESMLELYQRIAPHLNEPLYTRPVREFIPNFREWFERFSPSANAGGAAYSIK